MNVTDSLAAQMIDCPFFVQANGTCRYIFLKAERAYALQFGAYLQNMLCGSTQPHWNRLDHD